MSNSRDESSALVPSEVRELIEESRTVQDWLDRLESHEGDASPEVVRRIRKDYEGRLERAASSLARHRSELASGLETRQSELATLQADRDSQAADLEEARLRHVVGEFSEERWTEVRESIETSLSELTELLEMEESAVAELAAIVTSIDEGRVPTESAGVSLAGPGLGAAEQAEEDADASPATGLDGAGPGGGDADEATDDVEAGKQADAAHEPDEDREDSGDLEADDARDVAASLDPELDPEGDEPEPEEPAAEITVEPAGDEPDGAPVGGTPDDEDADEGGEYLDELEFLESLSLEESDRFDAVSAMLEDEDPDKKK